MHFKKHLRRPHNYTLRIYKTVSSELYKTFSQVLNKVTWPENTEGSNIDQQQKPRQQETHADSAARRKSAPRMFPYTYITRHSSSCARSAQQYVCGTAAIFWTCLNASYRQGSEASSSPPPPPLFPRLPSSHISNLIYDTGETKRAPAPFTRSSRTPAARAWSAWGSWRTWSRGCRSRGAGPCAVGSALCSGRPAPGASFATRSALPSARRPVHRKQTGLMKLGWRMFGRCGAFFFKFNPGKWASRIFLMGWVTRAFCLWCDLNCGEEFNLIFRRVGGRLSRVDSFMPRCSSKDTGVMEWRCLIGISGLYLCCF